MDILKTIGSLRTKGYAVSSFDTMEQAVVYIDRAINNKRVGFGDSLTLQQMDLHRILSSHNEVSDPQQCSEADDFLATARKCLTSDIFVTSVNALSETGEMVNIDATGNRIAGSLFGHEKVFFVAGVNKVVPTLDDAIWRARNIAAPRNAKRLQRKTPCAIRGDRCYDCSSPDRICNGMAVYFRKMDDVEMEVVLIGTELGY